MIIKISHCKECYTLQDGIFKRCPKYKVEFVLTGQQKYEWYHDDYEEMQKEAKDLLKRYGNI